jgi:hypothetical protein
VLKPPGTRQPGRRHTSQTLFAPAWFFYKMSCHTKLLCRQATRALVRRRGPLRVYQACAAQVASRSTAIHFDSDSYLVGVDGHASFCMANHPDQFDGDLQMIEGGHKVTGIGSGIAIKGMGTFKFQIKDNIGQVHTIRVLNSLYVPSLKRVLFAPHHWAQEAKDHHPKLHDTWMANFDDCIVLQWNQRQATRRIPFNASTNTPVICTASGTKSYQAYTAVINALKACTPHFHREQVIQRLSHPPVSPDSDEFIVDENLLLPEDYYKQASEGVSDNADTVKHSNKVSEGGEVSEGASATNGDISKTERMGPLTFDPRPVLEQDDELTASDDQTKLMRWNY